MRHRFLLLLASTAASALAQETSALQACRGIAEAPRRLACYDALPLPATAASSAASTFGLEIWQVSDDSDAVFNLNNPQVTIRRGILGAFYLELDGTNRTARVKRLQ